MQLYDPTQPEMVQEYRPPVMGSRYRPHDAVLPSWRNETASRTRQEDNAWLQMIAFGEQVLRELPPDSDLRKCGFCMSPIKSFRERDNFCQVRIGRCGHLFHASRQDQRNGCSCYNRFVESLKHQRENACAVCSSQRREAVVRERSRSRSPQRRPSQSRSRTQSISS